MIEVYGHSDDCVYVKGDVTEEFHFHNEDKPMYLACSDGTLLQVEYTGIWRLTPLALNTETYSKVEAVSGDDNNYSDRVTLSGKITWVLFGADVCVKRRSGGR